MGNGCITYVYQSFSYRLSAASYYINLFGIDGFYSLPF